jgi:hypothetical protein
LSDDGICHRSLGGVNARGPDRQGNRVKKGVTKG